MAQSVIDKVIAQSRKQAKARVKRATSTTKRSKYPQKVRNPFEVAHVAVRHPKTVVRLATFKGEKASQKITHLARYTPQELKEKKAYRKGTTRSFKKGGRKILRKLL